MSILNGFFSNLGQDSTSSGSTRYGQYNSQPEIYHASSESRMGSQYGVRGIEITDLQPGESFEGEVSSVNGQNVQLKLAEGQYMVARLEGDVQLALGQILHFQVQSNQDSKIVLKPIYTNMLQQRVGEAALKAANIAVNEKNMQIVGTMIENGMSISKESLTQFNRLVLQHPQAEISNIISLNKMHIPITDNNLTQYENYHNLEHKLIDGIEDASNDIFKLYDELRNNNISKNIIKDVDSIDIKQAVSLPTPSLQQAVKFMDNILHFMSEEEGSNRNTQFKESVNPDEEIKQSTTDITKSNITLTAEENIVNTTKSFGNSENSIISNFIDQLKNTPADKLPDKIISFLNDNSAVSSKDLLQLLANDSELGKLLSESGKDKIYNSHAFKNILRNNFIRQWTLNPDEISEEGKITEFYRKLSKQSQQLSQIMENAADNSTGTYGRNAQNLHDNIEFMNNLNQIFHYVQLPLKFSNGHANGELYVYTNKKNLANKDGLLTAILHLDMEHLGSMDVNVSLNTDLNTVTTRFYLEESSISLIEQHIDELNNRLAFKGYKFNTFVEKRDDSKTVFEQIEEQSKGTVTPLSYQSFDIRT